MELVDDRMYPADEWASTYPDMDRVQNENQCCLYKDGEEKDHRVEVKQAYKSHITNRIGQLVMVFPKKTKEKRVIPPFENRGFCNYGHKMEWRTEQPMEFRVKRYAEKKQQAQCSNIAHNGPIYLEVEKGFLWCSECEEAYCCACANIRHEHIENVKIKKDIEIRQGTGILIRQLSRYTFVLKTCAHNFISYHMEDGTFK